MSNLAGVLNEVIRRVARRELQAQTKSTRKATAKFRRAIAALKRQVATLTRQLASVDKQLPHQTAAPSALPENSRFRSQGVKAHRARLGISARDYGRLVGVDGQTIYHWESGKSRPREAQRVRLIGVRALGKREALAQLGRSGGRTRIRGSFQKTGPESILALLKGKKFLSTADFNRAWKAEGRAGAADGTLGLLVKAKKLKRTKVKGERGSRYSLA